MEFIRESLAELARDLEAHGGSLVVRHALAEEELPRLAQELGVQAVFANRDDEPAALERDARVFGGLANAGITFHAYKDRAIFERDEVQTQSGGAFSVFTPYKRAWLAKLDDFYLKPYPVEHYLDALFAAA